MEQQSQHFHPDNPQDVSDLLKCLFELHQKGISGADQGSSLVLHLAATEGGKRLLYNAHRVVSMQIGKVAEPEIFHAQLWIQKLTGMFGSGSR